MERIVVFLGAAVNNTANTRWAPALFFVEYTNPIFSHGIFLKYAGLLKYSTDLIIKLPMILSDHAVKIGMALTGHARH